MSNCAKCSTFIPSGVKRYTPKAKVQYCDVTVGECLTSEGIVYTPETRVCKPCVYYYSKRHRPEGTPNKRVRMRETPGKVSTPKRFRFVEVVNSVSCV